MLKIINGTDSFPLNTDDFCIRHIFSGLDELELTISPEDEHYPDIREEAVIEYEEPFLVKAIDRGKDEVTVKCQLDLDELRADMHLDYSNGSDTVYGTISGVLPDGWAAVDRSESTIRRTVESEAATPLEIIQSCADVYSVTFRFRPSARQVEIINPDSYDPQGAFVTEELNLKELNFKGKSSSLVTRLYARGKDGLTFAAINGGKDYVEDHTYSDKVISAYWSDDRYEVAESLLEDAKAKLKAAAVPERSYECSVVDLAATNPELYQFQDFSLFSVVTLIDQKRKVSINHQVVEYEEYPVYPERNVVTLSSVAPKIQNTVKGLQDSIENPKSEFNSRLQNAIQNATNWITGNKGGYVIIHQNENGQPDELLVMDTPDIATAQDVWRWNLGGLGHSSHGYDGPYETAITQDGQIVADFITAGVLQGIQIIAEMGKIAGWDITPKALYKDYVAGNTVYRVYIQSPQSAEDWAFSTQISTDGGQNFSGAFYVRADGYVYANDIHIAGGTINIDTDSEDFSVINIHWGEYQSKIYGGSISVNHAGSGWKAYMANVHDSNGQITGAVFRSEKNGETVFRMDATDSDCRLELINGSSRMVSHVTGTGEGQTAYLSVENGDGEVRMGAGSGEPSIRMKKGSEVAHMDFAAFEAASMS